MKVLRLVAFTLLFVSYALAQSAGAVADLNGDGRDDIIVTSTAGENVVVLLNQGR